MNLIYRLLCAIRGHDAVMHFDANRLSLRCLNCGYETPGWSLGTDERRPQDPAADQEESSTDRTRDAAGLSFARRTRRPRHATS